MQKKRKVKKQLYDNEKLIARNYSFRWQKRYILWIPFALLSIIMVIIPLILVFIITLLPTDGASVASNWSILDGTIFAKIFKSFFVSIISTIICVLIAYPFCYFLSQTKSKAMKSIVFLITTMPMWLGSLIILVSLKSLLDKINGAMNSTYGDIFSIIGIVYLYIPYMMIPLYNSLNNMPKNLINASRDLGQNSFLTFFKVVLPYTKQALISGITLVLLPSITIVAVPKFLNNAPDSNLIGDIIMDQGILASSSNIALARACILSIVVSILMFLVYGLIVISPKLYSKINEMKSRYQTKKGVGKNG